MRKGLLELVVLNRLKNSDYYGYDLVQELKSIDGLSMREGTVYPILARLEEEGFVEHVIKESSTGPPRKYFRITREGRKAVVEMNAHWETMEQAVGAAKGLKKEARDEQ